MSDIRDLPTEYFKNAYTLVRYLDKNERVSLVRSNIDDSLYVLKVLEHYDLDIYSRIKKSPVDGVPKVYELVPTDAELFVVEDYIDGVRLDQIDKLPGVNMEDWMITFGANMCDILSGLHKLTPPIIHRDIKPQNIIVAEGDVYLIDFNISREYTGTQGKDTLIMGTREYAAPEQYGFLESDVRTDIYGLGATLRYLYEKFDISSDRLNSVIEKAMAFDPWGGAYYRGRKSQDLDNTERLMINKYWENLADYFQGCTFNGICVADTSGSMYGDPMAVALSIAMYCAERNKGDFANHFFTFSNNPTFVEIEGVDFVDKIHRMKSADWGMSTNVEAVFDQMLRIAKQGHCSQDEIPASVIIISDMEFNSCACGNGGYGRYDRGPATNETLFETIEKRWNAAGYKMPNLVFWNVQARQDNIPMRVSGHVSYVSGFSPVIFEQVLKGVTAYDLMFDKLDSERYACIR